MKTRLTLFIALSFTFFSSAAEEITEIKIQANPERVTVYLTGAELAHTSAVNLRKGRNLVVFTGLSSKLDPSSIVVDVESKKMIILSVFSTNNFLTQIGKNPAVRTLNDSLETLRDKIVIINGKKETLTKERDLLLKNDAFAYEKDVDKLKEYADFCRQRRNEIDEDLHKLNKVELAFVNRVEMITKQLTELNAQISMPSAEISVLVLAEEAATANFGMKYRIADAGWAPKYDIRVEDVTKPVNLFYRANIFNNSGVDWTNVNLRLSTADPLQGAQYPKMEEWNMKDADPRKQKEKTSELNRLKEQNKNIDFQTIQVDELSAEFEIALPYTIPSDSRPYLVDVASKSLMANYEYISVPKMDKDAFLVAKVVGWTELSLVSGNASVYYNGSYIGQSKINIGEISDTLVLSLGRDNKIAVTRVKKSEMNDHQLIGNYEKETFNYEITVRNNREIPVNIHIKDQVPVQNDSRISISFSELSGANYNKHNGEVHWIYLLQPGETKKVIFNFSVKYPKDLEYRPNKRTFRTVSSPSF